MNYLVERLQNHFRQDEVYRMSKADARQTLENVFAAAGRKPSSEPLEKLAARKKLPMLPYIQGVLFAACALGLTLIAPLAFIPHVLPMQTVSGGGSGLAVTGNYEDGGILCLKVNRGDIDLASTYMELEDGGRLAPAGFDAARNELSMPFPDPPQEMNIYIYTSSGDELQVLLTPID